MSDPIDIYQRLPQTGPYDVRIGRSLITMVEPHGGEERNYNRWYEDDHFYSGALACPWLFAGKRWVATRDLQGLRYPADSFLVKPLHLGCYLSVYWITEGRFAEHMAWVHETNVRLNKDGRIFMKRDHVFTAFQEYVGPSYRGAAEPRGRDATGPRDIHALDHPWHGLVIEVLEAPSAAARPALERWVRETHLPARLRGSPAAMCLVFRTEAMPESTMSYVMKTMETTRHDRRLTLLWFLEADPRSCWADSFAGEGDAVKKGGLGRVDFCAPFIPTVHGTDRHVDQLR